MTADERLDETIIDSFPASDPPSYWAGDANRGSGSTHEAARVTVSTNRPRRSRGSSLGSGHLNGLRSRRSADIDRR